MKKNILLILLGIFLTTFALGCVEHRRDRDYRDYHNDERRGDNPTLQINVH